ncbi:hexokinase-domain-containing protein [Halteromyces radiatus]|uniref:hexokinase-domain-containing protein n=1 Tax=Halteromyces radiatus TaxID=101107 RepID=UPI00221E3E46|nr:hexokinase-domain-containing protein [Halteromyces radiatus]KAI8092660.1 hexokinase-domain-containing protein [Halteromyces radiatus]
MSKHTIEANPVGPINGSPEQNAYMEELERQLTVDTEKLIDIKNHFITEMIKGLNKPNHTLAMIPSYVEGRLTGEEKGHYLALDLGGTNLRVVLVTLEGQGKFKTISTKARVSDELKSGPMRNLCDYIADCIDTFLTEQNLGNVDEDLALGFTFSFPVLQSKINRGILTTWTKGFNCSGAVGKDPVLLLQDALLRKHVPVKITALVNDTVGTLLSNAYQKPNTLAGLILGTGSNGAYIEKMSNIGKWEKENTTAHEMVINMELGAFDNERTILPLTRFDNKLDRKSINPHSQIFEKLISGMYLGEIVRNVITDMMDRNLLFTQPGQSTEAISAHYQFETSFMSSIEADGSKDLSTVREVLDTNLNLTNVTDVELRIVKRICELVGTRAARLAGAAIASIAIHTKVDRQGADFGIDGSLYEFYPSFESRMYTALAELMPDYADDIRNIIRLGLARDGSGVGAALTACVADRMFKTV